MSEFDDLLRQVQKLMRRAYEIGSEDENRRIIARLKGSLTGPPRRAPEGAHNGWSPEDHETCRSMRDAGKTLREISAAIFGDEKHVGAVANHIRRSGLPVRETYSQAARARKREQLQEK